MRIRDLNLLPKLRDGWSHLYVERCRIDQELKAIAVHDDEGTVRVPCANLALLMLGPGVSITHAAVVTLADSGCLVAWCGEGAVRFYAAGLGESRSAAGLLEQVSAYSDPARRLGVVRRMYAMRFKEDLPPDLTLQQIRGREGIRVRETYQRLSRETGVPWTGRSYRRDEWSSADPVNRALSAANACLYGVCHAAILSCGYSPAVGFVHTGKMLSLYTTSQTSRRQRRLSPQHSELRREERPISSAGCGWRCGICSSIWTYSGASSTTFSN